MSLLNNFMDPSIVLYFLYEVLYLQRLMEAHFEYKFKNK